MEPRMTLLRDTGGFILVTVLVIVAVGLLFGAGALLTFRFQCQMRIDRQHELEKLYAVRSALNDIRTYTGVIPENGNFYRYYTRSERDLGLIVRPVKPIFPDLKDERHFVMQRSADFLFPCKGQYNGLSDYEYGAEGYGVLGVLTNNVIANRSVNSSGRYGLAFNDLEITDARWWVNIGMRGTGGWLQEDYGRRYSFWPMEYVDGKTGGVKDIMRLCIIRNVTNESNNVGCRHGWPLSAGERALVFQITPMASGNNDNNAEMTVAEYVCSADGSVVETTLLRMSNCPSLCNMGMQLADDKVTMFYVSNEGENENLDDISSRGYTFSATTNMSGLTYNYFAREMTAGNITYGGIETNDYGKITAPELRAVFEVVSSSDARGEAAGDANSNVDFLTEFRVTPAYQYDVFLEHPYSVTNLATVAQKIGDYDRDGIFYTILTYDTHGTANKGFRRDEKNARKNKK